MKITTEQSFFSNWHLMRWIALFAGIFFVIQALRYIDLLSGLIGSFFLFQAHTNNGCIVGTNCRAPAVSQNGTEQKNVKEIEFTEIKES